MYAGVSVAGIVGSNYTIYAQQNLGNTTNWTNLGTITLTNGAANLFIDQNSPQYPSRFYQAVGP
jgi:hypothetical protein